ncbi:hypothetical protein Dimus_003345 [Dionaea muscipula]
MHGEANFFDLRLIKVDVESIKQTFRNISDVGMLLGDQTWNTLKKQTSWSNSLVYIMQTPDVILKKQTLGCYSRSIKILGGLLIQMFMEVDEAAAGFLLQLAASSMTASSDVQGRW